MSGGLLSSDLTPIRTLDDYSDEEVLHIRKMVCGFAEDAADAAALLIMLGLIEVSDDA